MTRPKKPPRRLVPADGFGRAVYELIKRRRRPDGTEWEAEDLATVVDVSGTTVRSWIRGSKPSGERLTRLASEFDVDAAALLRGEIKSLNPPQEPRPGGEQVPPPQSAVELPRDEPFVIAVRAILELMRRQVAALRIMVGPAEQMSGVQGMLESMARQVDALETLLLGTGAATPGVTLNELVQYLRHAGEHMQEFLVRQDAETRREVG